MTIRVVRWDCQQCGHTGILGPETKCPNCGSARPKGVRFYLPEGAEIVKNQEKIKEAKMGADWNCSFCATQNKAFDNLCRSCGNTRAASDKQLESRTFDLSEVPTSSKEARGLFEQDSRGPKKVDNSGAKKTSRSIYYVIGGIALIFIVLLVLLNMKKSITVEVVQMHWEREIDTEQYKEVTEEAWQVPQGGRVISSHQAVHHHRRVSDGYVTRTRDVKVKTGEERYVCGKRDMGNGYFEDKYCTRPIYETRRENYQEEQFHEEPVYQTKYRYAIFKWVPAGPLNTSGNDKKPQWADVSVIENDKNRRETGRLERYTILVKDEKGNDHEEKMSLDKWQTINKGDKLEALRNGLGVYLGLKG